RRTTTWTRPASISCRIRPVTTSSSPTTSSATSSPTSAARLPAGSAGPRRPTSTRPGPARACSSPSTVRLPTSPVPAGPIPGLRSCYIRPIAYYGYGEMGLNTLPCTVDVSIACWPWGAYLGDDAVSKGVRMKISSWTRHDHNTMPPLSKTTGNYVNSSLAKVEALKAGYDEAIMLSPHGWVSECTGENIFIGRGNTIITPPTSAGALEGITQDSVVTIA